MALPDSAEREGEWPPGPAGGLTGWRLLRAMQRDVLGSLKGWQQRFGDVVHLRIWPEHEVVVTDPALVRELLVTHHDDLVRWERGTQVFAQAHGQSVLVREGGGWRLARQTLQPAFSPKAVQSFVPSLADATALALSAWPSREEGFPIEQALDALAMDVSMRMVFSVSLGEEARVVERAIRVLNETLNAEMFWPASWPDFVPWKRTKREALRTLRGLIHRQVTQRLATDEGAWPNDLLTRLLGLHRQAPGQWPLHAVEDECTTAFLAGHETVAATLTWWCWCMASHPQIQAQAAQEVKSVLGDRVPAADDLPSLPLLARTLQETLRLHPAAPLLLTRRSVRPVRLGPWLLPARTMFVLPVHLLHRDARWFPQPEAFRPERFEPGAPPIPRGAFLPFGVGPRVCLGQHLALTEVQVVAAMLLQRCQFKPGACQAPPEPVMRVSWRPRQPLRLDLSQAASASPV